MAKYGLELRQAGSAIGAGVQPCTDLARGAQPMVSHGAANFCVCDAEANTDELAVFA